MQRVGGRKIFEMDGKASLLDGSDFIERMDPEGQHQNAKQQRGPKLVPGDFPEIHPMPPLPIAAVEDQSGQNQEKKAGGFQEKLMQDFKKRAERSEKDLKHSRATLSQIGPTS